MNSSPSKFESSDSVGFIVTATKTRHGLIHSLMDHKPRHEQTRDYSLDQREAMSKIENRFDDRQPEERKGEPPFLSPRLSIPLFRLSAIQHPTSNIQLTQRQQTRKIGKSLPTNLKQGCIPIAKSTDGTESKGECRKSLIWNVI